MADPIPPQTYQESLQSKPAFISSDFPQLPAQTKLKQKPLAVTIYQYNNQPLADRTPLLLVHGLRGEYWPFFRWHKVIGRLTCNKDFISRYKVYLLRYDSTADLDSNISLFKHALLSLYHQSQKPIAVVALSLGGNIVYESMLDKDVDAAVSVLMSLGTPFRGSPLFCADWMQYSIYKKSLLPLTRLDHSLAYRLYFARNPNLLNCLGWDNADNAIPEVGRFCSRLPLGPHGDLTIARTINTHLSKINAESANKKKLIAYSGYLVNSYMLPNKERYIETTVTYPYAFFTVGLPAHLAREHPVLKMLNHEISSIVSASDCIKRSGTPFVYELNDGITPVSSALFLPDKICANQAVAKESDLPTLRGHTDVKLARIFRNIDHLSFIDGYRPFRAGKLLEDVLNPDQKARSIFDWMVSDLVQLDDQCHITKQQSILQSAATK